MRFYEFTTEEVDRRGFLKGLAGAAALATVPGLAKAGEYVSYDNLIKDKDQLENVWGPRLVELQSRCEQMLAKLIRAAGPQWAKAVQGATINVESNKSYAQSTPSAREIYIDLTVFWDANDDTLAFVIGHELGHIALGHSDSYDNIQPTASGSAQANAAKQYRQQELDADSFAVKLARLLGYNKAEVFKFMHKQKEEYAYFELLSSQPNSTHPTMQKRIEKAKMNGFQLSKGGIQQLNVLATHLA